MTRLELTLQNRSTYPELRGRDWRDWLEKVVSALAPSARSLGIRFCGERAMLKAQREFRGRDSVTDVLSFPDDPEDHLGDILLCVPKARRQAPGGDTRREVKKLLLHGILHCLGYDHETDDGTMDALEKRLRRKWLSR